MASSPPTSDGISHRVEPLPLRVEASGPGAGIAVLTLDQPGKPVIVLDHPLIQRLEASLTTLPQGLRGLVLASSSSRAFVAGADLKTISEWDDDQLHRYLAYGSHVFGLLSQLPFPTAACINGAALGGGLELAMHCDGLIAAPPPSKDGAPGKPYPVGLPEAGLGLCPGWGGTNLLPARMDPAKALSQTAAGVPLTFDQAVEAKLFDAIAPRPEDLLPTAFAWIAGRSIGRADRDGAPLRWIGRTSSKAASLAGLNRVRMELTITAPASAVLEAADAGLNRGWKAALEVEQHQLVRLRHTPQAKSALAAFFAKSAPPPKAS